MAAQGVIVVGIFGTQAAHGRVPRVSLQKFC